MAAAKSKNLAEVAGMSDAAVKKATGREWAEWVAVLDKAKAAELEHPEIAKYVRTLGTPDWWTQMVTVGYERIRGLRDHGQRRGGGYEASKSRTFGVPVETLYGAFSDARRRKRWLPDVVEVRSATPNKRMRLGMGDETVVEIGFLDKGEAKSSVAIQHSKLKDKAAEEKMKGWWAERLEALGEVLA